jgi:ABC-type transporter MlaC component
MVEGIWRGLFGAGAAALLFVASTSLALAQTTSQSSAQPVANSASLLIKPVAQPAKLSAVKTAGKPTTKTAVKKRAPSHTGKQLAAARPKPPVRKLAAAVKAAPQRKIVAAKKPGAPTKIATATLTPPSTPPSSGKATPVRAEPPPSTQEPAGPTSTATTRTTAVPVSLSPPIEVIAPAPQRPTPDTPAAVSFVSNFLKEAFHIAKADGENSLQRRAELAELFTSKMDVKFIAGYTTADELTAMSSDIQQRFRAILVSYLVETYYPRLELAADPSIKVETRPGDPLPDGTVIVWTIFTKDGWGSQSVKWRLMPQDGGFKIVDIYSAGASLVQMERDTFVSVMRNGGLNGLMAQLDARTKQLAAAATN